MRRRNAMRSFLRTTGRAVSCSSRSASAAIPPAIIKFPFWRMAQKNRDATYVQLNLGEVIAPKTLEGRTILVDGDAAKMIAALKEKLA